MKKYLLLIPLFFLLVSPVLGASYSGPLPHTLPYSGYSKQVIFPKSNGEWWAIYYNGNDVTYDSNTSRALFDNSNWVFTRIYSDYSYEDNGVLGQNYFDVDTPFNGTDFYPSLPSSSDFSITLLMFQPLISTFADSIVVIIGFFAILAGLIWGVGMFRRYFLSAGLTSSKSPSGISFPEEYDFRKAEKEWIHDEKKRMADEKAGEFQNFRAMQPPKS